MGEVRPLPVPAPWRGELLRRSAPTLYALTGIDMQLVTGGRGTNEIVRARYAVAQALARSCPQWSLCRLGRALGRDRTTVRHALRRADAIAAQDSGFAALVTALRTAMSRGGRP